MNQRRRGFIKESCLLGGCFCGFASLVNGSINFLNGADESEVSKLLMQEWISTFMLSLNENSEEEESRKILIRCITLNSRWMMLCKHM